ncbi:MAG TPA: AMP-binding protein [Nevskiaceae bacterium]|nr:AMP-binding protein [Nevskiaceae bacterium]
MYAARHAAQHPDRPAFVMAGSGVAVSYAEFEARSNRLAHLLRAQGLKRLDHYAIFMENHERFLEACGGGERAGLYYTCVNSFMTAEELAYVLQNSESQLLITSVAKRDIAIAALALCPKVTCCLVVGGDDDGAKVKSYEREVARFPSTPIADESLGTSMLYSSGTTGKPKGILRPLPEAPPVAHLPVFDFLQSLWKFREGMVYLSPAPLYHSAPLASVALVIRNGGTAIIMEHFDPEEFLALVERHRVTHTQLVPTMFSRMLKLPDAVRSRYDLSSLELAIHAAAPCPAQVKDQMIAWWGPIIFEYYGATEAMGFTACTTPEWQAHRGTVGRVLLGDLHILDSDMKPVPKGTPGEIWFKTANPFEYFNDPARTALTRSADGTMTTVATSATSTRTVTCISPTARRS